MITHKENIQDILVARASLAKANEALGDLLQRPLDEIDLDDEIALRNIADLIDAASDDLGDLLVQPRESIGRPEDESPSNG